MNILDFVKLADSLKKYKLQTKLKTPMTTKLLCNLFLTNTYYEKIILFNNNKKKINIITYLESVTYLTHNAHMT